MRCRLRPDIFEIKGASNGPRVMLTGGIHGDEYEGPAAIADLLTRLPKLPLRGTVIAVPVANPSAWQVGTRTSPEDGLNLARTFPGDRSGSPTEQLAADLFDIAMGCDYLIDLHSGGVEYRFVPLAGYYGKAVSLETARHFGLPVLWQLPETQGVLSCEMHKLGKVTIGCEYMGGGDLSLRGAQDYFRGVLSCLAYWQMLPEEYLIEKEATPYTGDWQLAEAEGVFRALVQLGQEIAAGRPLAEIRNHKNEVLQRFMAPAPGRVLALRHKAYIRPNNWAVLVAMEDRNVV